jgi:hypothetical protein
MTIKKTIPKKTELTSGKWISVKDKKPEINESVLLFASHEGIDTQYWIGWRDGLNTWTDDALNYELDVTHWMPLPEKPKNHCPKCNHEWESE